LNLTSVDRLSASVHVFQNYRNNVEAVGEDNMSIHIESVTDIWAHVHPSDIFVSKRGRRDSLIYVQIGAECDWEIEHGLQIVYRSGYMLSRVSAQDGHLTYTDAYNLPEIHDQIDG
jgi:hypothetical protein